jgi:hypothetical protein
MALAMGRLLSMLRRYFRTMLFADGVFSGGVVKTLAATKKMANVI